MTKQKKEDTVYTKFKTGSINPKRIDKRIYKEKRKWTTVFRYVFPVKPFAEKDDSYIGDIVAYVDHKKQFYVYLYDDHISENNIKVFVDIPNNITPNIWNGTLSIDDPEFRAHKKVIIRGFKNVDIKLYPEYKHIKNPETLEDYKEIHIVICPSLYNNPLQSHRIL